METGGLGDLPSWARSLLEEARVAHLGFLDPEGAPRVLPVTFAQAGDALYSAIDEDKPKRVPGGELARVRWLRARPGAALTVDRYAEDWSQLAWVQVLGRVALLDPAQAPEGMAALADKYAPYRARPPAGPLLRLDPERVLHWRASATPTRR